MQEILVKIQIERKGDTSFSQSNTAVDERFALDAGNRLSVGDGQEAAY
jgi:hypothetical protein